MKAKILIVDDEKMTRDALARLLGRTYECFTAADGDLALAELERQPDIALVLTDYKMPGMNGIELIKASKQKRPALGAILITAFGEIELAVAAMKEGADDFLTKPITDLAELQTRAARAIALNRLSAADLPRNATAAAAGAGANDALASFTGDSPEMQRVYALIRRIAPTSATVLIEGPSGTGKELVAHALHALSPRREHPFIAVECSAFSEDLLKSELFGYEPGTFTGQLKEGKKGCLEAADGGTLFLDEIGEIDKSTQIALLRALETRSVRRIGGSKETSVDFRLVAATNRDLKAMVAAGEFREDLYYRLNVIGLELPALKDRDGDIRKLAERFCREYAREHSRPVKGIDAAAMRALENYAWPGNVRQLRNAIERAVVLAAGERLAVEDLPAEITAPVAPVAPTIAAAANENSAAEPIVTAAAAATNESLAETEKARILATLASCRGNKTAAAEVLGISRRTLHRKLNAWGIEK